MVDLSLLRRTSAPSSAPSCVGDECLRDTSAASSPVKADDGEGGAAVKAASAGPDGFERAKASRRWMDFSGFNPVGAIRSASGAAADQIGRRWSDVVSGAHAVRVAFNESVIDGGTLRKLRKTIGTMRFAFPEIPTEVSTDETITRPSIFEGAYDGKVRAVVIRNISENLLRPLAHALRTSFDAQGLPLHVTDGGSAIAINVDSAFKGRALRAFANSIGVSESEILRFGDQACAGGNDETMVAGPTGYNVGSKPALDPRVHRTSKLNALGTAEVLRSKNPSEVKAIATDYDHTLTGDSQKFHPEALAQIVRYLNGGTKIAIITGRGPSIFGFVLPELLKADLKPGALDNLVFALFNGSLFVPAEKAVQELASDTAHEDDRGVEPRKDTKGPRTLRAEEKKEKGLSGLLYPFFGGREAMGVVGSAPAPASASA
ncbi:MAG: hypothetical protein IPK13_08295 [Deltaproteobacteria bacterium]|nr:hypothetical protein [Deltaproteobacteria bacterium]